MTAKGSVSAARARLGLIAGTLMVCAVVAGIVAILGLVSGPYQTMAVLVTLVLAFAGMGVLRLGRFTK